jgi:hypothetical protein
LYTICDLIRVACQFGILVGIGWDFPSIYHTDTKGKLGWYIGTVNLAGTPFSLKKGALAPFLVHQAPLLRNKGVPTKLFKKGVPAKFIKHSSCQIL